MSHPTKTLQHRGEVFQFPDAQTWAGSLFLALPLSRRVLLVNALRHDDAESARTCLTGHGTYRYRPSRVLLQDLLGIPLLADLAAFRDAVLRKGDDPRRVQPGIPLDLIIDHSLMAVFTGSPDARARNESLERQRNRERFDFLRWCQQSFDRLRVIPPGNGIMHQINLEYLGTVVRTDERTNPPTLFPDTLVGTDSHTPMINGLGVLGWGVGGLEAEAAMLGYPLAFPLPEVLAVRVRGNLREGVTATDLVLTITERLRAIGVVDKFVEFTGPGLDQLTLADRATIANMAPEYGATSVFFPVDEQTIHYLRLSGRDDALCELAEVYCKAQGLWRTTSAPEPTFDRVVDLDLDEVRASVAGPRRPQDRVDLDRVAEAFLHELTTSFKRPPEARRRGTIPGTDQTLADGDIVIAAITSCTNTSNPTGMLTAALLARNADHRGLRPKPWIKTSLAPGSKVVSDYLNQAGLQTHLDALGFHVIGYGCTTCNGMSGPLSDPIRRAIEENDLISVAVLSGNRNFEARIHPLCRANYLASPALVIAYALVGNMAVDLTREPLGRDRNGKPVFLRDLWPSSKEVQTLVASCVDRQMFRERYADSEIGDAAWGTPPLPGGVTYPWQDDSTYVRRPPYFDPEMLSGRLPPIQLRPLVILGDSITTDHISPSGSIDPASPAGQYLIERGISEDDFNTYGTRRGNHELAMRATFANIQLKNEMVPEKPGPYTRLVPEGRLLPIFEAAQEYQRRREPLLVIAGKEYGCGSSRDWAAKGPRLLGVVAVLAESFERIHRSNLVCMGILPLEFPPGSNRKTLRLTGTDRFDVMGLDTGGKEAELTIHRSDGTSQTVPIRVRLETDTEWEYYRAGGLLPFVFGASA